MKKKFVILMSIFLVGILTLCCYLGDMSNKNFVTNVYAENEIFSSSKKVFNNTSVKERHLKVLTICIDPYINSKGKKASEIIRGQSALSTKNQYYRSYDKVIREYIDIFSAMTNGKVSVKIVGNETLKEFPTYNIEVPTSDGWAYKFDEESWLDLVKDGVSKAEKTNTGKKIIKEHGRFITYGDFNYQYLVDKFNLVERKNNDEFDIIWLCDLGEAGCNTSIIVGKNAYNAYPDNCNYNGVGYIKANCDNFLILSTTLTFSNNYLECLGYSSEGTLTRVFNKKIGLSNNARYTDEEFKNLNNWNKFATYDKQSPGNACVGNVRFAPNSVEDGDWKNDKIVKSSWKDWKYNYPNLTGETTDTNYKVWEKFPWEIQKPKLNINLAHKAWAFSCMPHVCGRDAQGFSNNWWDYIFGLDWAVKIENVMSPFKVCRDKNINFISYNITYDSGDKGIYILDKLSKNTTIEMGSNLVELKEDGTLLAKSNGTVILETYFDGCEPVTTIIEIDDPLPEKNYTITYDYAGGFGTTKTKTYSEYSRILTASENIDTMYLGYTLVGWRVNSSCCVLEAGTKYSIQQIVNMSGIDSTNIVLIAVWEKLPPIDYSIDTKNIIVCLKALGLTVATFVVITFICVVGRKN